MYERRKGPRNFSELVELMKLMDWNEWVENDDTGKLRAVIIGNMCGGKYELYEDKEFIGCTHDVVAAAQFVAEGWNYNESAEEAARRRNREVFEESIANGWIYG